MTGSPSSRAVLERAVRAIDELQAKLDAAERGVREPVAVVGIGCRFPGGAGDPEAYWRLLSAGVDAVGPVPADRWDGDAYYDPDPDEPGRSIAREGGFLEAIDRFDAQFFGIAPREAARMDPQHRLFLEVAWEALEHAGIAPARLDGTRTGVFVGLTHSEYVQLEARAVGVDAIDAYHLPGALPSGAAGRLSHLLGLHGPAVSLDTACSSSLTAVHLACQSLAAGDSDLVLAGGVNALVVPETFVAASKLGLMSPTGRCRTFAAGADGFVRGEGCGVVVLKRLSRALSDGDSVLAVILGSAVNHDGRASALSVPSAAAQTAVVRAALERADVEPGEVGYVEAHGTGTALGDPIEVDALAEVFGRARDRRVLLGAVKTNLGHLESAAGVAGLIKAVLAVERGAVPPNLHFDEPSPHVDWEGVPFTVPTGLEAWPADGRRVAGVSSFGYTGTNVHVVLAEPPAPERADGAARPVQLLPLSARRPEALAELVARYAERLSAADGDALADICHTAAVGRSHLAERLAVVAGSPAEARRALAAAAEGEAGAYVRGRAPSARRLAVGLAFPGTAPAAPARVLAGALPALRDALARHDRELRALGRAAGADLSAGDVVAGPPLVALQLALAELWRSLGLGLTAAGGTGTGAIAAAAAAGAVAPAEALRLALAAEAGETASLAVAAPAPLELQLFSAAGAPVKPGEPAEPGFWAAALAADPDVGPLARALREAGAGAVVALGEGAASEGVLPSLAGDGWRPLLESVAALYVAGADLDWDALQRGFERPRRRLPTYPFRRDRHWVDGGGARRPPARPPHPLLAGPLRSPALAGPVFHCRLAGPAAAYLREHVVAGSPVLPFAAALELGLAAGAEAVGPGPWTLESVLARAPLTLPDSGDVPVQLLIAPEDGGASFRVAAADAAADEWTEHVTGRVRAGGSVAAPVAVAELRARCAERLDPQELYDDARRRGIELGPSFRSVAALWRGDGEALAEVELPAGLDARGYRLHPALLDGCLQSTLAAWPEDVRRTDVAYVPLALDRLTVHRTGVPRLLCHARLRPGGADALVADLVLLDADGAPVAELEGLLLQRVDAAPAADWRRWVLEPAWVPEAASVATAGEGPGAEELERVSLGLAVGALTELGWRPRPGDRASVEGLARELGVVEGKRRLLARLLGMLAEDGAVALRGDEVEVLAPLPERDATGELDVLFARAGASAEVALLARCGPRLADVLRGACDPLELLFPDGSSRELAALYRDSTVVRAANELLAELVAKAAAATPADRPFRVLEVGAGTGGTTAHVLARLPERRAEYAFTDVAPLLVERARAEFAAPGVSFGVLDLDGDPAAQGVTGEFDVVVAANVVHATLDVRRTLERLRGLLAPGGRLVLAESVARRRWADLTFGLTDGWWRFADADVRPDYPLLPAERWLELLEEAGFASAAAAPLDSPPDAVMPQAVLVGRSELAARPALLLGGGGEDGEALAAALERHGVRVVRPAAGEPAAALAAAGPVAAVVHVGALRGTPDEAWDGAAALDDAARALHTELLELVQALARRPDPPRLVLVTRRAQPVADEREPFAAAEPLQAAVWGLGRVAAHEHPELRCTLVDLDEPAGRAAAAAVADAVAGELAAGELVVRGGRRLVATLRTPPDEPPAALPARLEPTPGRTLDGLELRPSPRRPPARGEVELRVRAAGLSFRDVLAALGEYPGHPGPLGGECAGEVVAVGAGVHEFEPGDRVVALAPGGLASHVTTRAELVATRPERLTFAEAATLPSAFVTADWALDRVARLRRGERVLVHSAAGGVGLAALQVARRLGATVLATAGSPAKRGLLRSLGVEHVFDSRTLEFEDGVLAATGGRGVDVVLESLGGDALAASARVLAPGGRLVELAKRGVEQLEGLAAERPDASFHAVDLAAEAERDPAAVGDVLRAVAAGAERGELEPLPLQVFPARRAGAAFRFMAQARHVGRVVVLPPSEGLRDDAAYVVTGGLAGIGLLAAERLAERGAGHLVLAGRSEPGPAAREAIARMEALGATVRTVRCDVSSESEVAALLADVRRSRMTLAGVVHAAGVVEDAALVTQDWERFASVLAPKARGAWILHRETLGDPLDFFVLFSSASALLGVPGQGSHAAANAFLDALAARRLALGLPALSIGWGPWAEAGAAARTELPARVGDREVGTMAPAEALAAFDHLLDGAIAGTAPPYVAVVPLREAERPHAVAQPQQGVREGATANGSGLLRTLAGAPEAARTRILLDHVRTRTMGVLGLRQGDPVDAEQPFSELGLDSLMAVELRNLLASDLGLERRLPATLVFDHPTPASVAERLATELDGDGDGEGQAAPAAEQAVAAAVDGLSEQEAEELLLAELAREGVEE